MGEGGGTGPIPKRKISVGFIQPEKLEGDIIYVQLTKRKLIEAEAVSNELFDYIESTYKTFHRRGKRVSNMQNPYMKVDGFLKMLEGKNDALVTEYRFKEDGLELTTRLAEGLHFCLMDAKKDLTKGLFSVVWD